VTERPFLELRGLSKRFGDHVAVDNLSLDVPRGSVLALLGPSGSGKTTTLRVLAGFEPPDAGSVTVDGEEVTNLPPSARRFGMVFQHYALFPHLTVEENVAFGLRDRDGRTARVLEMLALVDLADLGSRSVDQLSGGQQQRVALARALAPSPRLLLLDEPLSNLDPALRDRTRRELKAALGRVGITSVFVTHDQEEAFAIGDLVAVLRDGALEQVGTPPELYEHPATAFVATFVGRAGVLPGTFTNRGVTVEGEISIPARTPDPLAEGDPVIVVIRPEHAHLVSHDGVPGTVHSRTYIGGHALFRIETGTGVLEVEAQVDAAKEGERVQVTAERALAFAANEAP
jgi:ABC-type Fe3+/spermidine/putrescine transport system ATPase subunit